MELEELPEALRNEAKIHYADGYELESFEDGLVTMMKQKRISIAKFIFYILTLRWLVHIWLPNLIATDMMGRKYYLYLKEEDGQIDIATG
jgi:hypothetical protein